MKFASSLMILLLLAGCASRLQRCERGLTPINASSAQAARAGNGTHERR